MRRRRVHVELRSVVGPPGSEPPDLIRRPELFRALTSFIDNAADFARSEVRLIGRYDEDSVVIEVRDDGPGFSPDIFAKLGEPYVTSRPGGERLALRPSGPAAWASSSPRRLLEAHRRPVSEFRNDRSGGARMVTIRWPRDDI